MYKYIKKAEIEKKPVAKTISVTGFSLMNPALLNFSSLLFIALHFLYLLLIIYYILTPGSLSSC